MLNELPSILETLMLVCFGVSWPLNLIKNYRARSAKATSLTFLVLIELGYVAGIIAKAILLSTGRTVPWYVLTIYIFNLISVSLNLIVYFRNRRLDRESELRK